MFKILCFLELTKKKVFKVFIIVAFIVVAIIIGLCLGLVIEGTCDYSKFMCPVYKETSF